MRILIAGLEVVEESGCGIWFDYPDTAISILAGVSGHDMCEWICQVAMKPAVYRTYVVRIAYFVGSEELCHTFLNYVSSVVRESQNSQAATQPIPPGHLIRCFETNDFCLATPRTCAQEDVLVVWSEYIFQLLLCLFVDATTPILATQCVALPKRRMAFISSHVGRFAAQCTCYFFQVSTVPLHHRFHKPIVWLH